jgi:hypothetical protein
MPLTGVPRACTFLMRESLSFSFHHLAVTGAQELLNFMSNTDLLSLSKTASDGKILATGKHGMFNSVLAMCSSSLYLCRCYQRYLGLQY